MGIYSKVTEKKVYRIVDGPSRDNLIDALKYAYDKDAKIPLSFSVATGLTLCDQMQKTTAEELFIFRRLSVCTLGHEDGSGYSFNITGYCAIVGPGILTYSAQFSAYYNAKHRNGTMQFRDIKAV